jgi:hypothetical protein
MPVPIPNSNGEPVVNIAAVLDSDDDGKWVDIYTVPAGKTLYVYSADISWVGQEGQLPDIPTIVSIREKPCGGREETPPDFGDKLNIGINPTVNPLWNKVSDEDDPIWQFNGGACIAAKSVGGEQESPVISINMSGVLR